MTQQPHSRIVIRRTGIARIAAAVLQGRQLPRRVGAGAKEALIVPRLPLEVTIPTWDADLPAVQSGQGSAVKCSNHGHASTVSSDGVNDRFAGRGENAVTSYVDRERKCSRYNNERSFLTPYQRLPGSHAIA